MYRRELLKGSTEALLLTLLAERSMYGYQLVKEIEKRSAGYFRVKDGTIYPALYRMAEAGLVESMWEPSSNGQQRRYYLITPKGHQTLTSMKEEWDRFCRAVGMVMAPELSTPS